MIKYFTQSGVQDLSSRYIFWNIFFSKLMYNDLNTFKNYFFNTGFIITYIVYYYKPIVY